MFNLYPYTDFHELNLDMILRMMKDLHKEWTEFEAVNKITNAGAWNITKQYQAWTVVSDNNIGYISLKPVPVGVAISNTEYWGLIADYDILITDISNRISTLEQLVINRKYILIGDSYGDFDNTAVEVWTEIVPRLLGLTPNVDYWVKSTSGSGFTAGTTFLSELQSLSGDIQSHSDITDIIVLGGVNDINSSLNDLDSAISSFITYARNTYPNAIVHIGHISITGHSTSQEKMRDITLPAYMACSKYGAVYAPLQNVLCNMHYLRSDLVHPTADGQILLSAAIYNYIKTGNVTTKNNTSRTIDTKGVTLNPASRHTIVESEENGSYHIRFPYSYVKLHFDTPIDLGNAPVKILDLDANEGLFPRTGTYFTMQTTPVIINGTQMTIQVVFVLDTVNSCISMLLPFAGWVTGLSDVTLAGFNFSDTTFGS